MSPFDRVHTTSIYEIGLKLLGWRFGVVVSALVSINEVNLRWAWLVRRWVTVSGLQSPVPENLSQYITSHPGQLSLAIPPWVGVMSTSKRVVMPYGCGVKAGMVREWVAGKSVWSPSYHRPYLSALAMGSSHNRAQYKCLYFTLLLCLTSLMEGFPWDNLHEILHGGQRMASVHSGKIYCWKV